MKCLQNSHHDTYAILTFMIVDALLRGFRDLGQARVSTELNMRNYRFDIFSI